MTPFTHLHVHTEYSLLDGLSRVAPLVQRAKELGMDTLAITDHGSLYGVIEFYTECRQAGIRPIIGCEVYVAQGSRHSKTPADRSPYHMTLLAKDDTGYRNLIQLVTKAQLEGFYYKPRVDNELLEAHHEGLIALSGCPNAEVPRLLIGGQMEEARERALWFKQVFGDFYLELQDHEHIPELEPLNQALIALNKETGIPLLLTNDCHYVQQEDAPFQDLLICIQTNTNIQDGKRLRMEDNSYHLRSSEEMASLFPDIPEAYENTRVIADMCHVEIDFSQLHLPEYTPPEGQTAEEYLAVLCWEGLRRRVPEFGPVYEERLRYELDVIRQTNFPNYFLVVWDIAAFSRRKGILFGVRGSAAASLALYAMGVTDVDPMAYRLVFERFLNVERKEMPDIDMDFQDDKRDEVIQYITDKYGRDHVAQIVTFGTMGPKAALRDTGRALAMPYADVDSVARLVPFRVKTLDEALSTVPEIRDVYEADDQLRNLIDSAKHLEGVVRNVGTHAAGVVISKEPLAEYVPLQRPTKGDEQSVAVTQFPMEPIARLGLLKMDILGLVNLSILDRAINVIAQHRGEQLDLQGIPLDDARTFLLLSSGETTGVFQLEGSGMRRYIKELKPSSLLDVAAMIALYRPGPMEHIDTFIQAKHGKADVHYLHPVLKEVLEETYGVIVYQDQVLLIVQALAGYSLGEADIVRKAMGKKDAAIMQQERDRFIQGALARGYEHQLADQVFALIEPFAGYAFNKAHSVSYALIAYWTAYFKANYPVEYMTALLNSHMGNLERVAIAVDECTHLKIKVLPPDINHSDVLFKVDADADGRPAVRFGLGTVKHVGTGAVETMIASRDAHEGFGSLAALCRNADQGFMNRRTLESLIKVGALDDFGPRGSLLASMDRILSVAQRENHLRQSGQTAMFDLFGESVAAPLGSVELVYAEEVTDREKAAWETELLGKQISDNPISRIAFHANTTDIVSREQLDETPRGRQVSVVGQVSSVRFGNTREGRRFVASTLELLGGAVDVVAWSQALERNPAIWVEGTLLWLVGKVQARNDKLEINVSEAKVYHMPTDTSAQEETMEGTPQAISHSAGPPTVDDTSMIAANGFGAVDVPAHAPVPPASGTAHAGPSGEAFTNGNGQSAKNKRTVVINLADTGNPADDTYLLRSAVELLMEYPGQDAVHLEISNNGQRTTLEMPLVTTSFGPELEKQLASLVGHGRARLVS